VADNETKDCQNNTDKSPSGMTPADTSPAAPAAMPDRTLVMNTDSVDRTIVMNDESVDRTIVMNDEPGDRTIILSPENGITRATPEDTQSVFEDARSRIQGILHKPVTVLSSLTGTGTVKRDVGAEIEGMDHHRKRAEVRHIDEGQVHMTELEDRFEIDRKLAEGSRYTVSIGQDLGLERQVAVYSLREEKLMDPDERTSFMLEAEISAQLDHPSILPVYSINSDYRGGLHSAVKLTDGTDLRKYLDKISSHYRSSGFRAAEEAVSLSFRLELILGISDGLVYAHSRGVVHANLNPQNVMIGEYHEVYIKGWGYACFMSSQDSPAQLKRKPPEINDPSFIAPEIVSGAEPTVRSDVYALGMILYELVTLHPPFPDAPPPEILENLRNGVLPTVEHRFGGPIDPDMRAIIQTAIAPDPEKRYQTVAELAEDIRRFLHSDEVSVRKISLSKRFAKLIRAHHRRMFFCFLTLIVLVGALIAYNIFNDVRLAQISYLDDHVLGKAQSACRKTAHQFNLQAEKFTAMLESIKFETEFLLSGHIRSSANGTKYLAAPNDEAVAGNDGIRTEYSPPYGDSVSFHRIEVRHKNDLDNPEFTRLALIQPTLFRYMLQAPLNAFVSKDSLDKLINQLTQNISPIFRIQVLLKDGASLYYPYTVKSESPLVGGDVWYDQAVSSSRGQAVWNIPAQLENAAPGTERIVLPVSIPLGPPDDPVGAAAILVSGRYFDQILTEAGNFQLGLVSQYFISKDYNIKLERVNNGPGKPPTVHLEKGEYPDSWLREWLADKEYGAVIRKEPGGPFVYCCAFVPAMEEWYMEKIRLKEFLRGIDPAEKGGLK
jgi:serine/threonine protein kinase